MNTDLVDLTEYDPVKDWDDVDELDGINIDRGKGCPHCGAHPDHLDQGRAGYYLCGRCLIYWAGDRENASLHEPPVYGPVGSQEYEEEQ